MRWIRRLYDWVLSWAETPYGNWALFLLAFAESSFFPIPPDFLLIALCIGERAKCFRFALVCSVASLLGGIAGYLIGWGAWAAVDDVFFNYVPGFNHHQFERVQHLYDSYNFWIVFVAAFTPIPFKVITITAGVFGINFPMFVIGSVIGRSARFFLVAWMLHHFGAPIRDFIDKYFNILTVVGTALLIGGFYVIKVVL